MLARHCSNRIISARFARTFVLEDRIMKQPRESYVNMIYSIREMQLVMYINPL